MCRLPRCNVGESRDRQLRARSTGLKRSSRSFECKVFSGPPYLGVYLVLYNVTKGNQRVTESEAFGK